jgi:hypothetical protein
MNANEMIDTGIAIPRIAKIWVVGDLCLEVLWAEGARAGKTDEIDLSPAINSYKVYRPLRQNQKLFKTARLIDEGTAVAWGNNEIDMSAETIETFAQESMTSEDFAAFLVRNRLTQADAARLLGRSRRQIAYYLNPGPVPRVIALACYGLESLRNRARVEKMGARQGDTNQPVAASQKRVISA